MFRLDGKKALITGSTRGIGLEIAKTMHALGAKVGITDMNMDEIKKVVADFGDRAVAIGDFNLMKHDDIINLAKEAEDKLDGVDILVNNAGMTKDNLSMRMKQDEWDTVLDLNLDSPFWLSREILIKMMRRKWGRVINIASVVGIMGNFGQSNYSASKGGLIALSKTLAREYASRNITVNSVSPGFIETQMTDKLSDEVKQKMIEQIPLGRMGTPSEVANVVAWLATEESGYITGQNININGGMLM